MERMYELREKLDDDMRLLKALLFGLSCADNDFGLNPEDAKNFAEVTASVFERIFDNYYELRKIEQE